MVKTLAALMLIFSIYLTGSEAFGQRYEAETATLAGGATKQACAPCSGGFMVAQGEGNLTFAISLPKTGYFNIHLRAASSGGSKINQLFIDGNTLDFSLSDPQYNTYRLVGSQKLSAGPHVVKINKSWGWINIDYLELEEVSATGRFSLNQRLVHPNPLPEAKALYDFLLDNYGDKIISGVMTLNSFDSSDWLKENTGKEPALLGIDFMHSGRGYTWYNSKTPINDAKTWYGRNGIPTLLWHWRDPSRATEEFYTYHATNKPAGTTFDISKVNDPNSAEYKAMLADIDYIAGLLKELQDQNVPVIWRPLHEAAGGWFWWGAKGAAPLKALWILMYDRMVNHHSLKNLIWVWTREPNDDAWYPGDQYVDMVGRDVYKDGDHGSQTLEFNDMNTRYGGKKMVTLSETGSFPDVDNLLKDDAAWSWYMPWYGGYTKESRYNSLDLWRKMFASDYVLTLDEMPVLKTYLRQDQVTGIWDKLGGKPRFRVYPTEVQDDLNLQSDKRMESVAVYNSLGALVSRHRVSGTAANISFKGLAPGVYFVRVDRRGSVRVVKK